MLLTNPLASQRQRCLRSLHFTGLCARPAAARSAQSLPAAAALPPNLGIAWPVAALPPELLAAQHALAAQLADAAAAAAARPAGPRVFSVTDRQVYVEDDVNHPSVYVMARRWVHNDPEGAMEPMPQVCSGLQEASYYSEKPEEDGDLRILAISACDRLGSSRLSGTYNACFDRCCGLPLHEG